MSCCGGGPAGRFFCSHKRPRCRSSLREPLKQVAEVIARDVPVDYVDESHIRIDHMIHECTGPRTHVRSTGKVQGFRLLKHFVFDPYTRRYLLVGCVGEDSETYMQRLDRL